MSFHIPWMIADHCRNLGRVGKIETLLFSWFVTDYPRQSVMSMILSFHYLAKSGTVKLLILLTWKPAFTKDHHTSDANLNQSYSGLLLFCSSSDNWIWKSNQTVQYSRQGVQILCNPKSCACWRRQWSVYDAWRFCEIINSRENATSW